MAVMDSYSMSSDGLGETGIEECRGFGLADEKDDSKN